MILGIILLLVVLFLPGFLLERVLIKAKGFELFLFSFGLSLVILVTLGLLLHILNQINISFLFLGLFSVCILLIAKIGLK